MTRWILLVAVCVVLHAAWPGAQAQTPAGRIVRPNVVIHSVADLDRSIAFYRDAVGLPLDPSAGFPSGASQVRQPATEDWTFPLPELLREL